MTRKALPLAVLGSLLLAGCVLPEAPAATSSVNEVLGLLNLLPDAGGFEIEAPVPVLLVGFEPGTAAALQAKLEPTRIEHLFLNYAVDFPPTLNDEDSPGFLLPVPVVPIARWQIQEAPPATADAFFAAVAAAPAAEGLLDGNLAEDWLAENLAAAGFPLDPATPALVVLHGGDALGEHGWRYTFPGGWLEPVRGFGERYPFHVFDVSAIEDPYVTTAAAVRYQGLPVAVPVYTPIGSVVNTAANEVSKERVAVKREAYNYPLASGGADVVDALALLVTDATHFRLLQSNIYPVSLKPCHAVTLLLAIRGTSVSEHIGLEAEEYVDVEGMKGAFENLSGEKNVHVDLKVLRLPVDDPALDAMIPRHPSTLGVLRWYLDQNWEKYWVPYDGCEPYVSLVVSGDSGEAMGFGGIATYGVKDTHRISFSVVSDHHRIRETYEGPGEERINNRPEGVNGYDRINRLFAHETGHLMGQNHPHNVGRTDDGTRTTPAFSGVWNVMSYQNRERVNDFGAIDQANFQRNRAGFAAQAAMHQGLEGTAEFAEALAHLRAYRWNEASNVLIPMLGEGHDDACRAAEC